MNIVCFDEVSVATTGHFVSSAAAIVAVATLALYSSSPMGLIQVLFLTCITTPPIIAKMVKACKCQKSCEQKWLWASLII